MYVSFSGSRSGLEQPGLQRLQIAELVFPTRALHHVMLRWTAAVGKGDAAVGRRRIARVRTVQGQPTTRLTPSFEDDSLVYEYAVLGGF